MAKHLRVLLLGTTGIEKQQIASRLSEWADRSLGQSFRIMDFEKEYLTNSAKGGRPLSWFLAQEVRVQHRSWQHAWDRLAEDGRLEEADENTILCVHASIVRGNYGVRCVCDLNRLGQFAPDVVVTLIDDVYNQWWLTEHRAHGELHRGRPTLEQLIMARRTEQLLGDMLSLHGPKQARHLVLAVSHPRRTLGNYLFTAKRVVYLSFPISRPREMLSEDGNSTGLDAVNEFLKQLYEYQESHPDVAFVNPLAIDELPLLPTLDDPSAKAEAKDGPKQVAGVRFDLARRWDMSDFWPTAESLGPGPLPENDRRPLIRQQVENAAGLIWTDVGWRDFRMVMQADALAVLDPVMARERLSRGVEAEMLAAISEGKPVYILQEPELDPNKKLLEWIGEPGTMAANRRQWWINEVHSVDEMVRRLGA